MWIPLFAIQDHSLDKIFNQMTRLALNSGSSPPQALGNERSARVGYP